MHNLLHTVMYPVVFVLLMTCNGNGNCIFFLENWNVALKPFTNSTNIKPVSKELLFFT